MGKELNPFNSDEMEIPEPDFDEPDFPAPVVAAAALDPAALAGRLGWTLEPASYTEALKIGAALGLRHDDIMWPLILLQLRIVSTFNTVPDEVSKTVQAVMDEITRAARAEAETAAIEAVRVTKKEIFRMITAERNGGGRWGEWKLPMSVGGAGLAGLVGFVIGNASTTQYAWILNIAKFFGWEA